MPHRSSKVRSAQQQPASQIATQAAKEAEATGDIPLTAN